MPRRKLTKAEINAYKGLAKAARRLRLAQERAERRHQATVPAQGVPRE